MSLMPYPFSEYIPKLLKDKLSSSAGGTAFVNKMDEYMLAWQAETINVAFLKTVDRCPTNFLDEMNAYLEADFKPFDSERVKRQKIYNAVQGHKLRSLWDDDVKIRIDNITGESASLYELPGSDDYIFTGDGVVSVGTKYSTFGGDGINTDLGCLMTGGIEPNIAGIVYIDLGYSESEILDFEDDDSIIPGDGTSGILYYSSIGADGIDDDLGTYIPSDGDDIYTDAFDDVIAQLLIELENIVPAYYRVFLGFVDDDSKFIVITEV